MIIAIPVFSYGKNGHLKTSVIITYNYSLTMEGCTNDRVVSFTRPSEHQLSEHRESTQLYVIALKAMITTLFAQRSREQQAAPELGLPVPPDVFALLEPPALLAPPVPPADPQAMQHARWISVEYDRANESDDDPPDGDSDNE